jgi:hypothetical protein
MSILSSIPLTARLQDYQSMVTPYQYNGYTPGASFFEFNGKTLYFNLNCEDDYRKAYLACAPLKAVVNRRAQMFVNGKTTILNIKDKKLATSAYATSLQSLLNHPNVLQTGKQFKAQQEIYIDIFGYCPVLKVTPVGFPGTVKALWNLPPWLFDIDFTGDWYNQTEKKAIYKQFYLNWGGERRTLDMENVFLILDNSIGTDNDGNLLMPDSRVKSLELSVSNDVAAKSAANTLITKKGAIGILSKDPGSGQYAPLKIGDERESIQRDFRRYGMTGQEWQVIITDASLKWQSMSFPVKDLMLFETMTAAQAEICDGMGMYSYLMNSKEAAGTTFTNLNEAKKSQYQDFTIPDDEARTEQLSQNIVDPNQPVFLNVDYSHVECLQDSAKSKADALVSINNAYGTLYEKGLTKRNDWAAAAGQQPVPDGDKYIFENTDTTPLAVKLGVGGTQSLQLIISDPNLSDDQKKNALIILFGLKPEDAAKMAEGGNPSPPKKDKP